jgi:hypothetical protein
MLKSKKLKKKKLKGDLKKIKKNLDHLNNIIMKKLYIMSLLALFASCNSVTNKIIKEYKKQISEKDSCIINISNLVDFEWDKMYSFKYTRGIMEEKLPKTILNKLNGTNTNEFASKIIFTLNDSIVYYEEHSIDIERIIKNQVVFDISDTATYKIYPKEKAIFKVTREESDVPYYYLQQIE